MNRRWIRYRKLMAAMACGGITLGVIQGFALINFAQLFTNILSIVLSALAQILLGASASSVLRQFQSITQPTL